MNNDIFYLDPRLSNDSFELINFALSKVMLVNNSFFPWVMLIPRKNNLTEIIDLNQEDRVILMEEISLVSQVMIDAFTPDKLNIAALGNIVPQLHIHIVARYTHDSAWPQPVFGGDKKAYDAEMSQDITNKLVKLLGSVKEIL
jgi:diadenosine tetraphosphate (Ap4A) HIT family hydrolase